MSDAPRRQGGKPMPPPVRGPPLPPPPSHPRFEPIDREKTCPLLLRVFTKVKEVAPATRRRNAKLSFAFVYLDKHGRFLVREVGKTLSYGTGRLDNGKALAELGFEVIALMEKVLTFIKQNEMSRLNTSAPLLNYEDSSNCHY